MKVFKILLSKNNVKLGLIYSFSITKKVCLTYNKRNCKKQGCYKYCYCNFLNRLYPKYTKKMVSNFFESKKKEFVNNMINDLRDSTDLIRLHVEGDFYSQEYINKWFEIAKAYPYKKFYTYTKCKDRDFSKRPKNFIIYLSDDSGVWEKHYNKFDGVARVSFDKKPIKGFKPCENQINKKVTCNMCRLCTKKNKKVYFDKH